MSTLFCTAADSGRMEPGRTKLGTSFKATLFLFTFTPVPWITKECCPYERRERGVDHMPIKPKKGMAGLYGGAHGHEIGLLRQFEGFVEAIPETGR